MKNIVNNGLHTLRFETMDTIGPFGDYALMQQSYTFTDAGGAKLQTGK